MAPQTQPEALKREGKILVPLIHSVTPPAHHLHLESHPLAGGQDACILRPELSYATPPAPVSSRSYVPYAPYCFGPPSCTWLQGGMSHTLPVASVLGPAPELSSEDVSSLQPPTFSSCSSGPNHEAMLCDEKLPSPIMTSHGKKIVGDDYLMRRGCTLGGEVDIGGYTMRGEGKLRERKSSQPLLWKIRGKALVRTWQFLEGTKRYEGLRSTSTGNSEGLAKVRTSLQAKMHGCNHRVHATAATGLLHSGRRSLSEARAEGESSQWRKEEKHACTREWGVRVVCAQAESSIGERHLRSPSAD
ncbi:hypothetical protein K438DRAFT_1756669 [Mycena galopus ATCC 62051]|nr:hypothetical protein K438DRAFT_1756669 [Mycena galopus ATCC 62051]